MFSYIVPSLVYHGSESLRNHATFDTENGYTICQHLHVFAGPSVPTLPDFCEDQKHYTTYKIKNNIRKPTAIVRKIQNHENNVGCTDAGMLRGFKG